MAKRPDPVAPHERRTGSAGGLPFLPSAQPESEEFASIQAAAMERYRPRDVKREPPKVPPPRDQGDRLLAQQPNDGVGLPAAPAGGPAEGAGPPKRPKPPRAPDSKRRGP